MNRFVVIKFTYYVSSLYRSKNSRKMLRLQYFIFGNILSLSVKIKRTKLTSPTDDCHDCESASPPELVRSLYKRRAEREKSKDLNAAIENMSFALLFMLAASPPYKKYPLTRYLMQRTVCSAISIQVIKRAVFLYKRRERERHTHTRDRLLLQLDAKTRKSLARAVFAAAHTHSASLVVLN